MVACLILTPHTLTLIPVAHQHSNSVRSFDQPSPSSHTHPIHRSSHPPTAFPPQSSMPVQLLHPASLLTHFLQFVSQYMFLSNEEVFSSRSFFGEHIPSFNGDDHSSLAPIDLIGFALVMQSPRVRAVPTGHHIHIEVSSSFESI
jgi:hypothetical protein